MVDTISIKYNAFSATATLQKNSELEETVKFKPITNDIKKVTVPIQFDNHES
jgi:hypothetical protein